MRKDAGRPAPSGVCCHPGKAGLRPVGGALPGESVSWPYLWVAVQQGLGRAGVGALPQCPRAVQNDDDFTPAEVRPGHGHLGWPGCFAFARAKKALIIWQGRFAPMCLNAKYPSAADSNFVASA